MLEPFLMLTVLNCLFMFSSTVTTWQYRRHCHRCSSHGGEDSKFKVKKSKSLDDRSLRYGKNDFVGYIGDKPSKKRGKSSKDEKKWKKDKKAKSEMSRWPTSKEARDARHVENSSSTDDARRRAASPSSGSKSTVVMEVSTVQKFVQIFDGTRDRQPPRLPNETVTYSFLPENPRKVEFVVNSRSENQARSMERIDNSDHHA